MKLPENAFFPGKKPKYFIFLKEMYSPKVNTYLVEADCTYDQMLKNIARKVPDCYVLEIAQNLTEDEYWQRLNMYMEFTASPDFLTRLLSNQKTTKYKSTFVDGLEILSIYDD